MCGDGICACCKRCCVRSDSRESIAAPYEEEITSMNIEDIEPHYKDTKNIYAYAVHTMQNYIGRPSYPFTAQPKQLYPYIIFLCEGLKEEEYAAIKKNCKRKLNNIQLTVAVKEAKIIHPKNSEYSRIFCKLWVGNGEAQFSSVRDTNSSVLWDEIFVFDVEDYAADTVHLEVWCVRPGLVDKLIKLTSDPSEEDEPFADHSGTYFVGDAAEKVKYLPSVGDDVFWTLKKGPRRVYTRGQVKVYLEIRTKPGNDIFLHINVHMAFLRLCYEKQLLTHEGSGVWKNWLEILPIAALTLIQQHAIQHGITTTEQCLCSWLVASSLKIRGEDRISFYLLKTLLEDLIESMLEGSLGVLEDVIQISMTDFSNFTFDLLRDLHTYFDVQNIEMADELFYMLRCMCRIEIKSSSNYMDSYKIISEEAHNWSLKIIGDYKTSLEADNNSIELAGEALKDIMKTLLRNQIILDDIFTRAWTVSYTNITYKKIDEMMCCTIQPIVRHLMLIMETPGRRRQTSESLKMLQLYHNVRNLVSYVLNGLPSERFHLSMDEYSVWFGEEMILEWFLLCDLYTKPFIKRAILADTMERLDRSILHGTSVPDVAAIIDEMVIDVWMKLKWQDQFYTHGALIEAVKACVLDYAHAMSKRVKLEDFYCEKKTFEVSKKLCVALSSVSAMYEHLCRTKEKVKKTLQTAESAYGFSITDSMLKVENELQIAVSEIFLSVLAKVSKRIRKFISQMAKPKMDFFQMSGTSELYMYIENTLETMYLNLKAFPFYIALRQMWIIVLKCLKGGLSYTKGIFAICVSKSNIFILTLQALNQMKTIFYCDGHGLPHNEMDNKLYEEIKEEIGRRLKE